MLELTQKVNAAIENEKFTVPMRVAVMGCVVNGPGEAREADVGIASGNGLGFIIRQGEVVAKVPERRARRRAAHRGSGGRRREGRGRRGRRLVYAGLRRAGSTAGHAGADSSAMKRSRGSALVIGPLVLGAVACLRRPCRPPRAGAGHDLRGLPAPTTSGIWTSRGCRRTRRARSGSGPARRGLDRPAPRLRAALLRDPVRRGRRRAPRCDAAISTMRARATPDRTRSGPAPRSRAGRTAMR